MNWDYERIRKHVEELSAQAKYLLLYILTSPLTNMAGCYELSVKRITRDTGLTANEAEKAMAELTDSQRVYRSAATNEVLIANWSKYNWNRSDTTMKSVAKSISAVKDDDFREYLEQAQKACSGGFPMPHVCPIDTTSTPHTGVTVSVSVSDTGTGKGEGVQGEGDTRHRHGEFENVLLTDKELELLKARFPDDWGKRIDDLSYYIGSKGDKYRSHYRTILSWERKNAPKAVKPDAKYAKYR